MADERASNEDMERAYQKGYEDGVQYERPRAFGAGYKAGYDNGRKSVEDNDYCNNCPHLNFELVRCADCKYSEVYALDSNEEPQRWCKVGLAKAVNDDDYCSWGEK